jgi:hypothetical protein
MSFPVALEQTSHTLFPHLAARLFGAADHLLEVVGVRIDGSDQARYDQSMAEARKHLGDEEFRALRPKAEL